MQTVGYTLSAISLIWVFKGFNWRQAVDDFSALDWRYVTIAVIADLLIYVCGGWRWKMLLQPVAHATFWRAVQAIYIGLYANEILPFRPGEVIRCYLLTLWNNVSLSLAFSSAAIERVLEGVWLALGFLLTTFFLELPRGILAVSQVLGLVVCGLVAVLIFIARGKHHAHAVVSSSRWASGLRHVVEGVHAMGNRRTMIAVSGASLLYLVLQIIPVWALAEGYDLNISVWAACVVLMIIRVGTIIPNAPGNAGVFQAMCVLGLGLFGVEKSTAVGFSLMMFGVLTLPLLIGGFIAVALSGLKLDEIRTRARSMVEARMQVQSD